MTRFLVTAFDPFNGAKINPAQKVLEALPSALGGAEIHKLLLPTVFGESLTVLYRALQTAAPEWVLCMGQAAGRRGLTVERVAVNLMDAAIPDNRGNMPSDQPVAPGGPAAYFATLPVKAMAAAAKEAGVEASVSYSAGTFVCNQVMYGLLHALQGRAKGGFLHLPARECQAQGHPGMPWMPLEQMVRGTQAALLAAMNFV